MRTIAWGLRRPALYSATPNGSKEKLPQKSADFDWDCRKIRTGFEGVTAKMRKPKKNTRKRKKTLDTSPRKKAQSGGGDARNRRFAPSVFEADEYDELIGSSLSLPLELAVPEKRKKGRPTIPDNFLLGSRNSWLHFLEEAWPEIGLSLLNIRKDPSTTIEDIQKVFEPVQSKDNCDHGNCEETQSGTLIFPLRFKKSSLNCRN